MYILKLFSESGGSLVDLLGAADVLLDKVKFVLEFFLSPLQRDLAANSDRDPCVLRLHLGFGNGHVVDRHLLKLGFEVTLTARRHIIRVVREVLPDLVRRHVGVQLSFDWRCRCQLASWA